MPAIDVAKSKVCLFLRSLQSAKRHTTERETKAKRMVRVYSLQGPDAVKRVKNQRVDISAQVKPERIFFLSIR
jgi:hypothetical protein